jgi:hypothetical protein
MPARTHPDYSSPPGSKNRLDTTFWVRSKRFPSVCDPETFAKERSRLLVQPEALLASSVMGGAAPRYRVLAAACLVFFAKRGILASSLLSLCNVIHLTASPPTS